jgi:hypothetical protein
MKKKLNMQKRAEMIFKKSNNSKKWLNKMNIKELMNWKMAKNR